MQKALQRANIQPEQVKAVFMHLTGTKTGDRNESAAIKEVFGEYRPLLTGNKSYI